MTSAFLTFTKGQGHTTRSKVTDVEVSAFSECFLFTLFLHHRCPSFHFHFLVPTTKTTKTAAAAETTERAPASMATPSHHAQASAHHTRHPITHRCSAYKACNVTREITITKDRLTNLTILNFNSRKFNN